MKNFLFAFLLLLAACTAAPVKPVNRDLPRDGDHLAVLMYNESVTVLLDRDSVTGEGDIKDFSVMLVMAKPEDRVVALLNRLQFDCVNRKVGIIRAYQLDKEAKVIGEKEYDDPHFTAIDDDSMVVKAFSPVCHKPFHEGEGEV